MTIAAKRFWCGMLATIALGGAVHAPEEALGQLVVRSIADQPPSAEDLAPGARITDEEPEPLGPEEEPLLRPFLDAATGFSEIAFGDTYVPNMMGDLLGATQSVSYFLTRTGPLPGSGPAAPAGEIDASGAVHFRNAKVAENNSPIPRDRVSFRYNRFHNALDVTGYSMDGAAQIQQLPWTIPAAWGLIPLPPEIVGQPFPDIVQLRTRTRSYHVDLFTFAAERTFADGLLSLELRVPFSTTLASHLDLTTGTASQAQFGRFDVVPTPERTWGEEATQWGDMTLILKGLLRQTSNSALSGGLSLGMPTGRDTRVVVTDYLGFFMDFEPAQVGSTVPGPRWLDLGIETIRNRTFRIENQTWSLSPFLAAVHAPAPRVFSHGFLQVEVPLNKNRVEYTRRFQFAEPITITERQLGQTGYLEDVDFSERIREQTLLHVDLGAGYWFYLNPEACRLKGIAGLLELHYTTTLNEADTVSIPGDPEVMIRPIESIQQERVVRQTESGVVGNRANRLDIMNLTTGATFLVGRRTTVGTAFAFPLRDGFDGLFDWELNVQLNYYR